MKRKGQMFSNLIVWVALFIMFVLASPIIGQIINENLPVGSATRFLVKLFLWVLLLGLVALFFKIVGGGDSFI